MEFSLSHSIISHLHKYAVVALLTKCSLSSPLFLIFEFIYLFIHGDYLKFIPLSFHTHTPKIISTPQHDIDNFLFNSCDCRSFLSRRSRIFTLSALTTIFSLFFMLFSILLYDVMLLLLFIQLLLLDEIRWYKK